MFLNEKKSFYHDDLFLLDEEEEETKAFKEVVMNFTDIEKR